LYPRGKVYEYEKNNKKEKGKRASTPQKNFITLDLGGV
jgi:hypothetical protein